MTDKLPFELTDEHKAVIYDGRQRLRELNAIMVQPLSRNKIIALEEFLQQEYQLLEIVGENYQGIKTRAGFAEQMLQRTYDEFNDAYNSRTNRPAEYCHEAY